MRSTLRNLKYSSGRTYPRSWSAPPTSSGVAFLGMTVIMPVIFWRFHGLFLCINNMTYLIIV
uniref:Uncharacterized protein n=1 Tax=Caudovirales sp. ctCiv1 TaxID=2826769 RepID=A0A8S5M8L5_9CAUD|nr:MAG TPA: hypothetical protein [Caudovirales sp. ctCiv1]